MSNQTWKKIIVDIKNKNVGNKNKESTFQKIIFVINLNFNGFKYHYHIFKLVNDECTNAEPVPRLFFVSTSSYRANPVSSSSVSLQLFFCQPPFLLRGGLSQFFLSVVFICWQYSAILYQSSSSDDHTKPVWLLSWFFFFHNFSYGSPTTCSYSSLRNPFQQLEVSRVSHLYVTALGIFKPKYVPSTVW